MNIKYKIVLIVLLSFLTYFNTLGNNFTSEDFSLILNNQFIQNLGNSKILFSKNNLLRPFAIKNGARPLTLLSLMVDFRIWKYNALGYHLTNVLLHTMNCLLIFLLFIRLGADNNLSFMSALAYVIHPVVGEVVNVPGFRGDLLAVMFFIIGILLFINMIEKKNYLYLIPLIPAYLFALLSKETAIVLPFILLSYIYIFYRKKSSLNYLICLLLSAFGGLYLIFFWLARYSYKIHDAVFVNLTSDITPLSSFPAYLNTILLTFFHYIKSIFFPIALSYDYQITISNGFSISAVMGLLTIIFFFIYMIKTKNNIIKFSLAFFFISYIPASNAIPLFNIVADRYIYLPLAGFSFFVIASIHHLFSRINISVKTKSIFSLKPVSIIAISIIILGYGASFNRNFIFKDLLSLYENTVEKSPDNPRARYNLAIAYKQKKNYLGSIAQLNQISVIDKTYRRVWIWHILGENYQLLGEHEKAKIYYKKVLLSNPKRETVNNLANIFLEEGNISKSRYLWNKVLDYFPEDMTALSGLTLIETLEKNKK